MLFSQSGIATTFENLEGFPEDWRERPEGFVQFVREHHVPSFLEYGEYPFVTAEEVKKGLGSRQPSRPCSTRCSNCAQNPAANECVSFRKPRLERDDIRESRKSVPIVAFGRHWLGGWVVGSCGRGGFAWPREFVDDRGSVGHGHEGVLLAWWR